MLSTHSVLNQVATLGISLFLDNKKIKQLNSFQRFALDLHIKPLQCQKDLIHSSLEC